MICPNCGSENVQAFTEQYTTGEMRGKSKQKGFGGCKACIGTLILGPIGFFCGLCGMGKGKGKIVDTSFRYVPDVVGFFVERRLHYWPYIGIIPCEPVCF